MSTGFEKLIARHELMRRRAKRLDSDIRKIEALPESELERILSEPDEPEKSPKL